MNLSLNSALRLFELFGIFERPRRSLLIQVCSATRPFKSAQKSLKTHKTLIKG